MIPHRRRPLFLCVMIAALCAARPVAADVIPDALPEIQYMIETDKELYHPGETVHVVHRVINAGEMNYTFRAPHDPVCDLWILKNEERIWSYNRVFLPRVFYVTIAPGESIELRYEWDMTDDDGDMIGCGHYDVVGVIWGDRNVRTSITVVPEPTGLFLLVACLVSRIAPRKGTRMLRCCVRGLQS
jgi:hypothetical protein